MQNDPIFYCPEFSIAIEDASNEESSKTIFKQGTQFKLQKEGIYTLEGANRSGKSILIKYLLGALPSSFKASNKASMVIDGKQVTIENVSQSMKHGVVAVFQDDELIPTMTIKEQLILRHYKYPSYRNWLAYLLYSVWHFATSSVAHYTGLLIFQFEKVFGKAKPNKEKAYPEFEITERIKKLFEHFDLGLENLNKYPRQLSGGTKDTIRVINALLTSNLKLLFLDEALNHVNESNKAALIEKIKAHRRKNGYSIVIVSHDMNELLKWQPNDRFFVDEKEKTLKNLSYNGYSRLESGITKDVSFLPVFNKLEDATTFLSQQERPFFILIDSVVYETDFGKKSIKFFSDITSDIQVMNISICEGDKNFDKYIDVIQHTLSTIRQNQGTFIIMGGGVLLNFGAFLSSTLFRGTLSTIVIPTTVMAIADVAIGGKSGLNISLPNSVHPQKHIVGTYYNPSAVIVDQSCLSSLSEDEKQNGLAECVKHGLLQSKVFFTQVCNVLSQRSIPEDSCFEIALTAQLLKSETLMYDPREIGYGRLLLYGHLHAHSIERLSNFKLPHGLSVYWGMLLDLYLSGNKEVYKLLLTTLDASGIGIRLYSFLVNIQESDKDWMKSLELIYQTDSKKQHRTKDGNFISIAVEHIGQYSEIGTGITDNKLDWSNIRKGIEGVIGDLREIKLHHS